MLIGCYISHGTFNEPDAGVGHVLLLVNQDEIGMRDVGRSSSEIRYGIYEEVYIELITTASVWSRGVSFRNWDRHLNPRTYRPCKYSGHFSRYMSAYMVVKSKVDSETFVLCTLILLCGKLGPRIFKHDQEYHDAQAPLG